MQRLKEALKTQPKTPLNSFFPHKREFISLSKKKRVKALELAGGEFVRAVFMACFDTRFLKTFVENVLFTNETPTLEEIQAGESELTDDETTEGENDDA